MVFARTAIFWRTQEERKNLLCEQREVYRVPLECSEHFLYFPLAAIHMEIFFFKIKQNILKRGFNSERTKFFEASLGDTLSRSTNYSRIRCQMTSHFRFTSLRACSDGSESKGHKKNKTTRS